MKLKAVFNSVIVKPLEEEEQKVGNIIVSDLGKEKGLVGTIVSVGPGHTSVTGNFISSQLQVGDRVYLPQMGPVKIEFEGVEYWACPENIVLACIEKEN